jgi:hypothetical protein
METKMDDKLLSQDQRKSTSDYRAALDRQLGELQMLNTRMQDDQIHIDRLKAETRLIAAHTDSVLTCLEAQVNALQTAA